MAETRVRTRGSLASSGDTRLQEIWASCSNTSWNTIATYKNIKTGKRETMTDVIVPGFHGKVRRGEIFFNPMTHQSLEITHSRGAGFHDRKNTPVTCSGVARYRERDYPEGDILGYYYHLYVSGGTCGVADPSITRLLSGSDVSSAVSEAATRVMSQRGRGSSSNLYETLAESRQALSTIPSIINSIGGLLGKRSRKIKSAADAYLAYRYGILPLISDGQHIIEALGKKLGSIRETTRGYASLSTNSTKGIRHSWTGGGFHDFVLSTSETINVRAMSLDEYYLDRLTAFGFGAKNLITVPWELIPYSFVVDWVFNVGDFIGSLAPSPGLRNLGGCVVSSRETVSTFYPVGSGAESGYTLISPLGGSISLKETSKMRSPGLPAPAIVLKVNLIPNKQRLVDALALFSQRIK